MDHGTPSDQRRAAGGPLPAGRGGAVEGEWRERVADYEGMDARSVALGPGRASNGSTQARATRPSHRRRGRPSLGVALAPEVTGPLLSPAVVGVLYEIVQDAADCAGAVRWPDAQEEA